MLSLVIWSLDEEMNITDFEFVALDKNGRYYSRTSRSSFEKRGMLEVYEWFLRETSFMPPDLSLYQRYAFYKEGHTEEFPRCFCGNPCAFLDRKPSKYCSSYCALRCPLKKRRRFQNSIKKTGRPSLTSESKPCLRSMECIQTAKDQRLKGSFLNATLYRRTSDSYSWTAIGYIINTSHWIEHQRR